MIGGDRMPTDRRPEPPPRSWWRLVLGAVLLALIVLVWLVLNAPELTHYLIGWPEVPPDRGPCGTGPAAC